MYILKYPLNAINVWLYRTKLEAGGSFYSNFFAHRLKIAWIREFMRRILWRTFFRPTWETSQHRKQR